jgi:ABC-2 type transport system ATP-binding protein
MVTVGRKAPDSAVVDLVGLTKRFGRERGIADVSLQVSPNQVFGFLGPNGAGKSTAIRLLMGLYLPSAGRAEVFGLDSRIHGPQIRRRVGYLPGELVLHPRLTGRDILDRVARIRGDVDPDLREHLESRFGAEVDRPVHTLSKGNRQKIGLVQAFMHDPDLLILDEPTSGLDPLLRKEFADLLDELVARGRTVFLSSHDLDEVQRLAHQIAIIREGRLVTVDTVEGLRDKSPRTMELTFRRPVDISPLSMVAGTRVTEVHGPRVTLTVDGEVGPVLSAVATMDVVDITARPADLDELFRSYYRPAAGVPDAR